MKVFRKSHPDSTKRREGVIGRLNNQLKLGTKVPKGSIVSTEELTPGDIARINKELETLKKRI